MTSPRKILSGATLQNPPKKSDSRITHSCNFAKTRWYLPINFHWPGPLYYYIDEFLWDLQPDSGLRLSRQEFFLFPDGFHSLSSLRWPQQVTCSCWASTMGQRLLYGTWRMHPEEKLHPSPMNLLAKSFVKHITPENKKASLSHCQSSHCETFTWKFSAQISSQHARLRCSVANWTSMEDCLVANPQLRL